MARHTTRQRGQQTHDDLELSKVACPDARIEIRLVDGREGELLAERQARVLREVTRWQLGQSSSTDGPDLAA
ncbi:hypothetical protein GZH49_12245 [Nocardia terpenica]|uniref:hypothetical protein n=1 Tax=Nocardia terpenica TaxID=455432 RepID=UPI002FE3C7DB